ncbi:hypothetical protein GCM10009678_80220 [Actinomadura kijaniata]|uniref:Probable multidrug resistance protein NorM n=1 Tax=Actinomadura namibiensis TaxID=182080 RepID=A0A7W3LYX8_ACTNM|nr:MATE family efflux transporter [Actinomadura namibiensis]MBA8956768.1 Na+-driven multidrug efflux pump [Actinomadura namibiensis]
MTELRRQIVRLTVPMMAARLLAILVPILIIGMLGWMDGEALQIRSLYMPMAFLFFALQAIFDVATQTIMALRSGRGEHDAGPTLASMALVWLVGGLVFAGALSAGAPALAEVLGAPPESADHFAWFLRWMAFANMTLAGPVLCAAALRGTGRAGTAALIVLVGSVLEVAGLAVLGFGADMGTAALPLATVLNGLVGGALGIVLVSRAGLLGGWGWQREVLRYLPQTGLPVCMSSLVMFGMNLAFVRMLSPFGPTVIAGFATAATVQNLLVMPALTLGSASAIVMNQRLGADRPQLAPVLRTALRITVAVYAVITPVVWLSRGLIGSVTAENGRIAEETARYFAIVAPSYLALALVLAVMMALQQVGGVRMALSATVLYVVLTVAVGAWASQGADGPVPLYSVMSAMNVGGLLAVAGALAFVRRQDRRRLDRPAAQRVRA